MNLRKILFLAIVVAGVLGCSDDSTNDVIGDVVFNATVDDSENRISFGDESQGKRSLRWNRQDAISVFDDNLTNCKFILTEGVGSSTASFSGSAAVSSHSNSYYALYPYDGGATVANNTLTFTVPSDYTTESVGYAPMVARSSGYNLHFAHLYGFIELRVTGVGYVSAVTLTSATKSLSGEAKVSLDYSARPEVVVSGSNSITMRLSEPILLSGAATPILVMLPAGSYDEGDLTITIYTHGGECSKSFVSSKARTITAAHIKPIGGFVVDGEVEYIDLNADSKYANCYILPKAGYYSFGAKARGGIVEIKHPKTNELAFNIASATAQACVAWESTADMITDVVYNAASGTIGFRYSGVKGNALICLVDNGVVLWSWHLWCTDTPDEQLIGDHLYLDRNVGAWEKPSSTEELLSTYLKSSIYTSGKSVYPTVGLMWQWGRPVPFPEGARYHIRCDYTWYQREVWDIVMNVNGTQSEVVSESWRYGDTPVYNFPSEKIMGGLYYTTRVTSNTNRWWYTNNTTNITWEVAMQTPLRIYGTANSNVDTKYWCNDLFANNYDYATESGPWNYSKISHKIFDVCPKGYCVAQASQTIEDFGKLKLQWIVDAKATDSSVSSSTSTNIHYPVNDSSDTYRWTHTGGVFGNATDGSFVWIPITGMRSIYGAYVDEPRITWWGSVLSESVAAVAFESDKTFSGVRVVNGHSESGVANSFFGVNYDLLSETAISSAYPVRCVKDEGTSSQMPIEDITQTYDNNEW